MSRKKCDTNKKSLGERIKQIRLNKNLTQQAFAKPLGIDQSFLSELENSKYPPSKPLLLAISYVYQININWLLTGEEKIKKPIYEIPEKDNLGVVKEDKRAYTTRPTIRKIVQMLDEMGDDDLRGIFRYIEKEKLLKDLLEEKRARGEGKGT